MGIPFQQQHAVMLLKYSGISFISGAVNHGFFSGERSLWTAATGVLLFVLGLWLETRGQSEAQRGESLEGTLAWGTLLSVGLGFFTGGLQHFPDSPSRSAWVVPLGFALSAAALLVQQHGRATRAMATYVATAGTVVLAASAGMGYWLAQGATQELAHGHAHEAPAGDRPTAQVVTRTIEIAMTDAMRFQPGAIQVQAGETVRIVARNEGRLPHELVIGTEGELQQHAAAMRDNGGGHAHAGGAALTVAPGTTGDIVVTYPKPAALQIACLVPGHLEAGMRGTFNVVAQLDAPIAPAAAPGLTTPPPAGHDHGAHQHRGS